MNHPIIDGPAFNIESDKAFIVLGHSERKKVGEFFESTLEEKKIFDDVDVVTLNRSAAMIGRASLRNEMKRRTVIAHSASIMRLAGALQIVAINPPEQTGFVDLLKRANEITKDPIIPETGAHKTGLLDFAAASVELVRSPITTIRTMTMISGGYSAVNHLIERAEDFPAGRAIVHSDHDGFGFFANADMERAAQNGVTTVVMPDHYHNGVLFVPDETLDFLTPTIFPATNN